MATFIKKLSDNEILVNGKITFIRDGKITRKCEYLNPEEVKAVNNIAMALKKLEISSVV